MNRLLCGWHEVPIKQVGSVSNGTTPSRSEPRYWNSGTYAWLPTGKVHERIITASDEFVTQKAIDECSLKVFPSGSVLVGMIGQGITRGMAAYLGIDATINQNFAGIIPGEQLEGRFLFYYLDFSYERLRYSSQGSNQGSLNCQIIQNFHIPLPPLPEQRKIAEILGTWDEAIAATEKLIAALQRRKQGLMQRLLTGQVRFREFGVTKECTQETTFGYIPSDWDYLPIGDIAQEVSERNDGNNDLTVLSCTKYDGLVDSLEYFGRQIFADDTSTYKVVKRNQFAYATNHIEEGSIGYQNLYDEALISPMYTVFQTGGRINDAFLYRLLKTELYRHIFEVNTSGTVNRRGSLRWNDFSRIRVPVPSLAEQDQIAQVFGIVDAEIETSTKHLTSLQAQKKGLMQRLLTGQVRVAG